MSAVVAATRARIGERAHADVVIPLLAAYFAFAAYYVWQAWRRETPGIFTDELEFTQISRAIAHAGRPERRGVPYHFTSLYPYFTAPAWWLSGTQQAFAAVKYAGALAMTAAIFPAYALGRTVLSTRWALAAAVGAVAAPALSYSSILVEEPFAYPLATLALWLILRATLHPGRKAVALAGGAAVLAAATRSELAALLVVLALALGVLAWRTERLRSWRSTWSTWDWVGAVTLAIGAVVVVNAFLSHRSFDWYVTTAFYKPRLWQYGTWAGGGLAVGVGVLPVVGGLASLVPPRGETRDPSRTAFTIVAASAFATFGWYAAFKGAYISTVFSSLVVERNLIYLTPLLFVGTALVLERRGTRWWAALAAGGFALYLVVHVPYKTELYPYYEAHGLAAAAFANRIWHWPNGTIRNALVGVALVSTAIVLLLRWLPRAGRAAAAAMVAVSAAVLVWNVTAETYAANGEYRFSKQFATNFVHPFDWVDQAVGGGSVTLVGQQFTDTNGIYLTEFWNRSIKHVWSVDTTSPAPGPGPTLSPDLARPDGTLTPSPGTGYALAVNGVALQAPVVARQPGQTLYRLGGGPLELAFSQLGVDNDGWSAAPAAGQPTFSAYNRFDAAALGPGFAVVRVSRVGWAGTDVPGKVVIRLGDLVVGANKQPALGRIRETRRFTIHACGRPDLVCARGFTFKNPGRPFRIEVSVAPTFSPHDLDPRSSDRRQLGAQISFGFAAL